MKTQGEIEAAVCAGMTHFEQEYMGRGPKCIHTHLIGDLLVVRQTARPILDAMVEDATGIKPLSLHHDISTLTGEEVVVFTLAESPVCRLSAKRS
jgi:uncharacterized protein YbcI